MSYVIIMGSLTEGIVKVKGPYDIEDEANEAAAEMVDEHNLEAEVYELESPIASP